MIAVIPTLMFAGSSPEVRQAEGVQPLAQVRSEVHEDLPAVSHHLPLDRQDGGGQQSGGQALTSGSDIRNTLSDSRARNITSGGSTFLWGQYHCRV